jgi:hypothetical protein
LIIHGKNGPNWPDLDKENPNRHGFIISSSMQANNIEVVISHFLI